ncbi:hypothetical protein U1Q18_010370 [Sarracenia purpurea var. burkii]
MQNSGKEIAKNHATCTTETKEIADPDPFCCFFGFTKLNGLINGVGKPVMPSRSSNPRESVSSDDTPVKFTKPESTCSHPAK